MSTNGKKYDSGKNRWELLPVSAVEQIVKVLNFGADRYGSDNWQGLENFDARYYAALQRHLVAWRRGEDVDPDSGLLHLAHAGCCLVFLLSKEVGFDPPLTECETDRPAVLPPAPDLTDVAAEQELCFTADPDRDAILQTLHNDLP